MRPNGPKDFWARVTKGRDCWLWSGGVKTSGYGNARFCGRMWIASRLAWVLANAEYIPPGMCVLHSCDTPLCCNPKHLSLGTHRDNMRDMVSRGRGVPNAGESHGRCRYSDAFVSRVVAHHKSSGESISATARKWNLCGVTVGGWVRRKQRRIATEKQQEPTHA